MTGKEAGMERARNVRLAQALAIAKSTGGCIVRAQTVLTRTGAGDPSLGPGLGGSSDAEVLTRFLSSLPLTTNVLLHGTRTMATLLSAVLVADDHDGTVLAQPPASTLRISCSSSSRSRTT